MLSPRFPQSDLQRCYRWSYNNPVAVTGGKFSKEGSVDRSYRVAQRLLVPSSIIGIPLMEIGKISYLIPPDNEYI